MNYEFYEDTALMNNMMPYNSEETSMYQTQSNNKLDLFNPYEGYLKGNAFKEEYIPYKDYKVAKLNINSEKDELLINIGQYSFMMHDLNLYLDVHPNDQEKLRIFIEYRNKLNALITEYERNYGPLCVKGIMNNSVPFAWENEKWPWVN